MALSPEDLQQIMNAFYSSKPMQWCLSKMQEEESSVGLPGADGADVPTAGEVAAERYGRRQYDAMTADAHRAHRAKLAQDLCIRERSAGKSITYERALRIVSARN